LAKKKRPGPRVLLFDIETSPILAYVWGLWEQNVALNQIHTDWHVLSWSAKWLNDPPSKVMYMDQRDAKNIEDDKRILAALWKLLDEADIVVTQNGKQFDVKKLNARFILHGMQPPSPYKHIDTLEIAKKNFGFTSNKLEFMTDKLNKKYKKLKHEKFAGFELWRQCLAGNRAAWNEMRKYNKYDVLALEELYHKLLPWDSSAPNFSLYHDGTDHVCRCGSSDLERRGFHYTQKGKFRKFRCRSCGAWSRDTENLFSGDKKKSLHVGVKA
jgi:hypothetical protein